MFDEVQIEPMLFHGPGVCPNCLTPLILAEKELTVMDLDKNGNVINIVNTDIVCKAMCPNCGKKYDMMRSNGSYKPYSRIAEIFDKLDLDEEIKKRNNGRYHISDNPLSSDTIGENK